MAPRWRHKNRILICIEQFQILLTVIIFTRQIRHDAGTFIGEFICSKFHTSQKSWKWILQNLDLKIAFKTDNLRRENGNLTYNAASKQFMTIQSSPTSSQSGNRCLNLDEILLGCATINHYRKTAPSENWLLKHSNNRFN